MWVLGMGESNICSGGAPPSFGEYEHKKDLLEKQKNLSQQILLGQERKHFLRYHPA